MGLLRHSGAIPESCREEEKTWNRLVINRFLYSLSRHFGLDEIYGNNITQFNLQGSGTLKISNGCIIRNDDTILISKTIQEHKCISSFMPSYNISESNLSKIMTPEGRNAHLMAGDFIVQPITGKDLADLNNMSPFDFEDLWKDFLQMCPDADKVTWDDPTYAMGYAAQVLFVLGPESRTVKKPGQDRSWRLRFNLIFQDFTKVTPYMMVISTYKNGEPPRDA